MRAQVDTTQRQNQKQTINKKSGKDPTLHKEDPMEKGMRTHQWGPNSNL
jgi:hypothetical protein